MALHGVRESHGARSPTQPRGFDDIWHRYGRDQEGFRVKTIRLRGQLSQVIRAEQKLPQTSRDTLYTGKVNPIATFPGTGTVVYGQNCL